MKTNNILLNLSLATNSCSNQGSRYLSAYCYSDLGIVPSTLQFRLITFHIFWLFYKCFPLGGQALNSLAPWVPTWVGTADQSPCSCVVADFGAEALAPDGEAMPCRKVAPPVGRGRALMIPPPKAEYQDPDTKLHFVVSRWVTQPTGWSYIRNPSTQRLLSPLRTNL